MQMIKVAPQIAHWTKWQTLDWLERLGSILESRTCCMTLRTIAWMFWLGLVSVGESPSHGIVYEHTNVTVLESIH